MPSSTIMILAAGRGLRMGELTKSIPKPLIKFHDKPLIVWHLEKIAAAKIKNVVINLSYLGNQIQNYLGNGSQWDLDIKYSEENPVLETAGGIKKAIPLIKSDPFVVINSDIFTNYDYSNFHKCDLKSKEANLFFTNNPPHNKSGDYHIDSNGNLSKSGSNMKTFCGIGIYKKNFFNNVPKNIPSKLSSLFDEKIKKSLIQGQMIDDLWLDIGTPERLLSPIN
jgi:MurNAc alpha-1-phosphate uridylyltransferase